MLVGRVWGDHFSSYPDTKLPLTVSEDLTEFGSTSDVYKNMFDYAICRE